MNSALNHTEREYVEALQRRRDWLHRRIRSSPHAVSYDLHEKAALEWALRKLTGASTQEQPG